MKRLTLFILTICLAFQLTGQNKFEMRAGLSYNIADYKGYNPLNPNSRDSFKGINGPGLTIKGEYYVMPFLSIQTGLEFINTNISFNEYYSGSGLGFVECRHHLHILELQLPLNLKFSLGNNKELKLYAYAGVAARLIPYAYGKVEHQTEGEVNKGRARVQIFDRPIVPNGGLGFDYQKQDKKIGFFAEISYKHLLSQYFYGGGKNDRWSGDNLIDISRFISITVGLKFRNNTSLS